MIDFHTHILPALDDGAVTVDDAIDMAKVLSGFGYKTVCCTPHCIKGYYDLNPQQVREATLMLQADLDNVGIQIELWPGIEYMLDEYFHEYAEDLLPLGETNLVLCEAPPQADPGFVEEGLELIVDKGFVPLVAHPERTQYFYEKITQRVARDASREKSENIYSYTTRGFDDPVLPGSTRFSPAGLFKRFFLPRASRHVPRDHVTSFKHSSASEPENCLYHANLGSFTGFYGSRVQRNAYELLKLGAYTALASDLHESRTAAEVLVQDKFDNNPFLQKLAEFDGVAPEVQKTVNPGEGEQISLFNSQG